MRKFATDFLVAKFETDFSVAKLRPQFSQLFVLLTFINQFQNQSQMQNLRPILQPISIVKFVSLFSHINRKMLFSD